MTLEPQQLLTMYRLMATIRAFDNRAVEEFHAGNIPGVVHAYLGQEAIAVAFVPRCAATTRSSAPTVGTATPSPRAPTSR